MNGQPDEPEDDGAPPGGPFGEPVALPLDGVLDLHAFPPREVGDLVPAWIEESHAAGLRALRIVHGKGIGALRRSVEALLSRHPLVASWRTAGEDAGGWGATLVELKDAAGARLAIELHDSTVHGLRQAGGDLALAMRVHVHASPGRPGHDRGRGWFQGAELAIGAARIIERHAGDELWILDGSVTIAGQAFEDLLPLPCESAGPVELSFSGAAGTLRIAGNGLRIALTGEPPKLEPLEP